MTAGYYRTLFTNVSNFWRARQIESVKSVMLDANERMNDADEATEPINDQIMEFQGELCDVFGIDLITFFDVSDPITMDENYEIEIAEKPIMADWADLCIFFWSICN